MTTRQIIECVIYALAVMLCIVALMMAILSASFDLDSRVVYQGF